MSETSAEQTIDRKKPDEPSVNLMEMFEKMRENLSRIGKCVNLSNEVLSECCYKLEEMNSQMAQLESVLKCATANNNQQLYGASEEIQEKNQLSDSSDYQIIDAVVLEGSEKSDVLSNTSEVDNSENLNKKLQINPRDDDICQAEQANYECIPGPSQEATRITKNNQTQSREKQTMNEGNECEAIDTTEADLEEDAVEMALLNTAGVLSAQELRSFLYLSGEVENPVNLAKASFTSDIEGLYLQLQNFHFLVKVANDAIESERGSPNSNRSLEAKAENLIETFEAIMMNSESRHPMRFHPFRRKEKRWEKHLHHFA